MGAIDGARHRVVKERQAVCLMLWSGGHSKENPSQYFVFPEKLYVVHSKYAVISTSLGQRVEMLPVSSCACEIAVGLRNAELKMFKAFSLKRRSVDETKRLQSESWKVNVDTM